MTKIRLLSLFIFCFASRSFSQQINYEEVDFNALVAESQLNASEGGDMKFYWWIPVEFWKVTFAKDQSISAKDAKELTDLLEPYTIVCVVEGVVGAFGTTTYVNGDSLRKNVRLLSSDSTEYVPIDEIQMSFELQMVIGIIKPMMTNMMGELGRNMNFFVFNNRDKQNKPVFSPQVANSVRLRNKSQVYSWKTPFGSLMPKKKCPVDDELLNGAWDFCPWHGDRLKKQ